MNFDLEAAKRGEPIECQEAYGWVAVRFIGPWDSESAVCAVDWSYKPEIVLMSKLRMAKKREVVRYRRYISGYYAEGALVETINEGFTDPSVIPSCSDFIEWIDRDWQEYEIGANDEDALQKSL